MLNDCGFARLNPTGLSEFLEGNATSRPLRSDEQTLGSTYGSGRRNRLLVANREGDSLRVANCVECSLPHSPQTNSVKNIDTGRLRFGCRSLTVHDLRQHPFLQVDKGTSGACAWPLQVDPCFEDQLATFHNQDPVG